MLFVLFHITWLSWCGDKKVIRQILPISNESNNCHYYTLKKVLCWTGTQGKSLYDFLKINGTFKRFGKSLQTLFRSRIFAWNIKDSIPECRYDRIFSRE